MTWFFSDCVSGSLKLEMTFLVQVMSLALFSFSCYSKVITESKEETYLAFFKEVIRLTAKVVSLWQCVGFCHG